MPHLIAYLQCLTPFNELQENELAFKAYVQRGLKTIAGGKTRNDQRQRMYHVVAQDKLVNTSPAFSMARSHKNGKVQAPPALLRHRWS